MDSQSIRFLSILLNYDDQEHGDSINMKNLVNIDVNMFKMTKGNHCFWTCIIY